MTSWLHTMLCTCSAWGSKLVAGGRAGTRWGALGTWTPAPVVMCPQSPCDWIKYILPHYPVQDFTKNIILYYVLQSVQHKIMPKYVHCRCNWSIDHQVPFGAWSPALRYDFCTSWWWAVRLLVRVLGMFPPCSPLSQCSSDAWELFIRENISTFLIVNERRGERMTQCDSLGFRRWVWGEGNVRGEQESSLQPKLLI